MTITNYIRAQIKPLQVKFQQNLNILPVKNHKYLRMRKKNDL